MEPVTALVNGKKIKIPLGLRIPPMNDYQDFESWLYLERKYAVSLKEKLESGETSKHSIMEEMINWSIRTENEFKKVKLLRIEKKLVCLNLQIRISLNIEKPNLKRCIQLLQELNNLNFTSLMLTKNPQVVDTIDCVSRYEREVTQANSRLKQAEIIRESEEIKKMASKVIRKFRELFHVPDEKSFSEIYKEKQIIFIEHTAGMEQPEILTLTDESFLKFT
nr:uncharacterized protein LOC106677222 [Halyomorpha halys]